MAQTSEVLLRLLSDSYSAPFYIGLPTTHWSKMGPQVRVVNRRQLRQHKQRAGAAWGALGAHGPSHVGVTPLELVMHL